MKRFIYAFLGCALLVPTFGWAQNEPAPLTPEPQPLTPFARPGFAPFKPHFGEGVPTHTLWTNQGELVPDLSILAQDPKAFTMTMAKAIRTRNIPGLKVLVPIYEAQPYRTMVLVNFAKGLIDLEEENFSQAKVHFKAVLDEEPKAEVARFYYMMTSFSSKDYYAAQKELVKLKDMTLPDEAKTLMDSVDKTLTDMTAWHFDGSANVFYDGNANQAPDQTKWNGWTFEGKKKDWALRYWASVSKRVNLPQGFYLTGNLWGFGKKYRQLDQYDDIAVQGDIGLGYALNANDYGLHFYHQWRWFGNKPYTQTDGISAKWTHLWSATVRTGISLGLERERYEKLRHFDAHNRLAAVDLGLILSPRSFWQMGVNGTDHRGTRDKSDEYLSVGLFTRYQHQFVSGVNMGVTLGYEDRRYRGATLLTQKQDRHDKNYRSSLNLSYNPWVFKGIRPELELAYQKHTSNSALHRYSDRGVYVKLNKSF